MISGLSKKVIKTEVHVHVLLYCFLPVHNCKRLDLYYMHQYNFFASSPLSSVWYDRLEQGTIWGNGQIRAWNFNDLLPPPALVAAAILSLRTAEIPTNRCCLNLFQPSPTLIFVFQLYYALQINLKAKNLIITSAVSSPVHLYSQ